MKAGYLRALLDAGFRHLDAVAFVSPAAAPQMADSEEVLAILDSLDPDLLDPDTLDPLDSAEILGIVVNERGAERALRTGKVTTLGFPFSISPGFLARNQRQTPEQALRVLETIAGAAAQSGLQVVAYLSMAFGNPYGEPWSLDRLISACRTLTGMGIAQISLADTVGLADASQIETVVRAVIGSLPPARGAEPGAEIGVHLHARPDTAAARIAAALSAGCRRMDSAIGGLGGCPFAQDTLVGNIPTEAVFAALQRMGAETPALSSSLMAMNRSIADEYSGAGEQDSGKHPVASRAAAEIRRHV